MSDEAKNLLKNKHLGVLLSIDPLSEAETPPRKNLVLCKEAVLVDSGQEGEVARLVQPDGNRSFLTTQASWLFNHPDHLDSAGPNGSGTESTRPQDSLARRARRDRNPICPSRAFLACLALHAARAVGGLRSCKGGRAGRDRWHEDQQAQKSSPTLELESRRCLRTRTCSWCLRNN
jgi:hypothetical protein